MDLRLSSSALNFYVDIRLRRLERRWLAVADLGGDFEIGMGTSAREAVAASLAELGPEAADLLASSAPPLSDNDG